MSNDRYEEWNARFKDARSLMVDRSYEAACSAFRDALRVAETGCVSTAELADTLEGLATTQIRSGGDADVTDLLDRAETARQQVLDDTIAAFGKIDLKTANAYYKFAFHNIIRRRPASAISHFEETLAIKEAVFGELHFEVANTLMIMGGIHPHESEKTVLWHRAVGILHTSVRRSGRRFSQACVNLATWRSRESRYSSVPRRPPH